MKELKEETLGQRIRAQRIRIGMTQDELAETLCIPKSTISAYENDKIDIKVSRLIEISKVLNISPNFLLGYKDDFENGEDECLYQTITSLIKRIDDERIQKLLVEQIKDAVKLFSNDSMQ